MSLTYGVKQVMHRIRVKLYPNYLPGQENTFFARTDNEAILNVEDTCTALCERGGFKGDKNDLIHNIKRYNEEVAYQLCDGYATSNGYYVVYPNLGGVFQTAHETPDPKKHPLTFRFRTLSALRRLAEHIHIHVEGLAEADGYIDEYINQDGAETLSNSWFLPGTLFTLHGHKIKIEGDDPGCGLFFVDTASPGKAYKATRLNQNEPSTIRGQVPDTGDIGYCRLEIRTQYSGSGKPLKIPRIITSPFTLEQG